MRAIAAGRVSSSVLASVSTGAPRTAGSMFPENEPDVVSCINDVRAHNAALASPMSIPLATQSSNDEGRPMLVDRVTCEDLSETMVINR
jgi:hypothetical protein